MLVDDAELHARSGSARRCCRCSTTRAGWRHGRGGRRGSAAGTRTTPARPTLVARGRRAGGSRAVSAPTDASGRPTGPGPLHRHRRRRHVRHRPDHAGPRRAGVRQRRQGLADLLTALRARAPTCTSATTRPRGRRRHGGRRPPRSGTPTPSWSRPAGAACGCCTAAAALAAVMAGRRGDRGRRHPRQDHHHLDAHRGAAALRRGPVVRDRRRARRRRGAQRRTTAPATLFVAEADESDGSFLHLPPGRRRGHQRRGRPPRQLRHGRGGRARVRAVRRADRPDGCWSSAPTTPGPGALRRGRAARACASGRTATAADLRLTGLAEDATGAASDRRCSTAAARSPPVRVAVPGGTTP